MSQKHRFSLLLTYIPFLLVLMFAFLVLLWKERQDAAARKGLNGRYSAQQILRLSEAIGPALVPESAELKFTASPLQAQDRMGTRFWRKWQVDISDKEGNVKGSLRWDADTGLVEQVSRPLNSVFRSSGRLTRAEAVEASLRWLVTLHKREKETWKLEGTPEYVRGQWQCRFFAPDASAYISVEASEGELVYARTRPRSTLR